MNAAQRPGRGGAVFEGYEGVLILPLALLIYGGLALLRRSDGKVGRAIRDSDWQSWNDAVRDKEDELRCLREVEPRR